MSKLSTEKELIQRFQQGDAMAFNTIYNRFYSTLRYFSQRLTCQKREAEDIAVETFVKLYRLCGNFENVANIRAFLYVTARNACYDYLSYSHRRPAYEKELHTDFAEQEIYPLKDEIDNTNALKAIFEAIERLPEECGKVFKLAYVQGFKTTDIVRLLAIPEQTVRSHRRRSVKLLRIDLFEQRLPEAALACRSIVRTGAVKPMSMPMTDEEAGGRSIATAGPAW
ncbi:RNA polymerase sigma factor [Paraflavitalea soli]|uniref:RNA polymerase sigma factor n=1 Tax=Paraflavitalea soli TaxID=2315862 RepID=A0A3B7MTE8_9BACT|nr:RNA polymerase sigma factor [Paraflavitalea soli]AXY73771.1 RNA polymerase sigma factor [Paraflavitalea soli]